MQLRNQEGQRQAGCVSLVHGGPANIRKVAKGETKGLIGSGMAEGEGRKNGEK